MVKLSIFSSSVGSVSASCNSLQWMDMWVICASSRWGALVSLNSTDWDRASRICCVAMLNCDNWSWVAVGEFFRLLRIFPQWLSFSSLRCSLAQFLARFPPFRVGRTGLSGHFPVLLGLRKFCGISRSGTTTMGSPRKFMFSKDTGLMGEMYLVSSSEEDGSGISVRLLPNLHERGNFERAD